jgi:uncharacterized membrane protein YphA (DoxX/SURF4 family)
VQSWLASLPRQRAQAIMRVLTGATLLYAGIEFKVLQPNLCLGIITTYHLPLLWRAPESFTLLMALVEITAGLLIILGILLRPLSLVLLAAFFFFASFHPESYTSHIMFYGVMLSFLFRCSVTSCHREPLAQIGNRGAARQALPAGAPDPKRVGEKTRGLMRGRLVVIAGSLVVVVVTADQAQRGGVPLFGEPLQQNIVVSKAVAFGFF